MNTKNRWWSSGRSTLLNKVVLLFFVFNTIVAPFNFVKIEKAKASQVTPMSKVVQNPSFEPSYGIGSAGQTNLYGPSIVPGWSTTGASIPILRKSAQTPNGYWGTQNTLGSTGGYALDVPGGDQLVYQDIATVPGSTLKWSYDSYILSSSRQENGVDLMFGPPALPIEIHTSNLNPKAWTLVSGTYLVPAGQTVTRIGFKQDATTDQPLYIDNFKISAPPVATAVPTTVIVGATVTAASLVKDVSDPDNTGSDPAPTLSFPNGAPNTSTPGTVNVVVRVTDNEGDYIDVTVPLTVKAANVTITEKYVDEASASIRADTAIVKNIGETYTGTPLTIGTYIYLGYKLDADSALKTGNPTLTNLQTAHTVQFVYGKDANGNGIVDSKEITVTEKYVDRNGSAVGQPDTTKILDKNSTAGYSRAVSDVPDIDGYVYVGYKLAGETDLVAVHTGDPVTIAGPIATSTAVRFVYAEDNNANGFEDAPIVEKYVDEAGTELPTQATTISFVDVGQPYSKAAPAIDGYIYMGYKVDLSSVLQTGNPSHANIQEPHTITMVYGKDANGNEIIDSRELTITSKFHDEQGATIRPDEFDIIEIGGDFSEPAPTISGYIYKGYKLDSIPIVIASSPGMTDIVGPHTFTYEYGADANVNGIIDSQEVIITEKYVDRNGQPIGQADSKKIIDKLSSAGYSRAVSTIPTVNDYIYVGYKLAGESAETALHTGDPVTIAAPISSDTAITFVYAEDKNDNGKEDFTITEKYVDEAGATIAVDTKKVVDIDSDYSGVTPTVTGYTYLSYKVDAASTGQTGVPTIPDVVAVHTVTMVYGQDQNNNGTVDVTVDETYVDEVGAEIALGTTTAVDKGTNYSKQAPVINNYIYMGYKVDGSATLQTGDASLLNVQTTHQIVMVYGKDANTNGIIDSKEATITAKYVDEAALTIRPDNTKVVEINGTYSKAPPTITGYIYLGYKVDSDTVLTTGNPTLTNLTASHTVTLVYGADANANGIVDSQEVIVTEKYVDRSGNAIGQADTTKILDKNSTAGYSRTLASVPTIDGSVYLGYKRAGESAETALHTGDPITIAGPIAANTSVTFVYGQDKNDNGLEDVTITEKYVDEVGTTIGVDSSKVVDIDSDYSGVSPTITDFTYLNFKIDHVVPAQSGEPTITDVKTTHTVTMVYGQDKNDNGLVDVSIGETYVDEAGAEIATPTATAVDKGTNYSKEAPVINNYVYMGYKVDGNTTVVAGNPSLTAVQIPHQVVLVYGKDANINGIVDSKEATITAKYVDESGTTIRADDAKIVEIGADYTKAAPTITGYIYHGYTLDSDQTIIAGNPTLIGLAISHTVTLVYGADANANGIIDSQEVTVTEKYLDRNGTAIGQVDTTKILDKNSVAGYSRPLASLPTVDDYVYLGYKLAGESAETALHTSDPMVIAGPVASNTSITYVYGQDKNDNAIEDVTIIEKYVDEAGTTIAVDTSKVVDIDVDYIGVTPTLTDFTYLNYKVDGSTPAQTGVPTITDVKAVHIVTMVYGQDKTNNGTVDVTIGETYVDEAGIAVATPTTTNTDKGSTYSKLAPTINNYVYMGYKIDGSATVTAGNPSLTNVQMPHQIVFVYGKDTNTNGIVDSKEATITAKYVDELGTTIRPDDAKIVEIGGDYSKAAPTVTGYIYLGYKLDSDLSIIAGNPSLTDLATSHTVTLVYGADANANGIVDSQEVTVTEKYVDRKGNAIGQVDTTKILDKNSVAGYSRPLSTIPTVDDYMYVGYKRAGESAETALHTGDPVTIAGPIASNTIITYVYAEDKNDNGLEDVTIVEKYVDEANITIAADTSKVVDIDSDYTGVAPTVTNFTYLNYKVDDDLVAETGVPTIVDVNETHTVTMVYGQDQNNNGTVDVTVGETYVDEAGAEVATPTSTAVDKGTNYSKTPPTINNYIYMGYKVDADATVLVGDPSLTAVQTPHQVVLVYGKDANTNGIVDSLEATITAKYIDEAGATIRPDDAKIVEINDDYTKAAPTITGYIYLGYKLDSEVVIIAGNPSLTDLTASHTVTLVYGADANLNGIVDSQEVTVTEKYVDRKGNTIGRPDTTKILDKNSTAGYNRPLSTLPTISDYMYVGYKRAGESAETALHTGDPMTITGPVTTNTTITYVYAEDKNDNGTEDVTIIEKYVSEAGATIGADTNKVVDIDSDYIGVTPTITDYTYLHFAVDDSLATQTGVPTITDVNQAHTVTMVYGQDQNNNGTVDVSVGETYVDEAGVTVTTPTTTAVDKGTNYSKVPPTINNYVYMGYKMDGTSILSTGNPSLTAVQVPHQVVLVYGKDANTNGIIDSQEATITAKYVDESGSTIKPDDAKVVEIGGDYTKAAPTITGYIYQGYKLDSDPLMITGNPGLNDLDASHTVTLVYGADANANGIFDSQEVIVTEKYVDRNGNAIGQTDTTKILDKNSAAGYSRQLSSVPTVTNYFYVGYRLAGDVAGTALHTSDPVTIAGPIVSDTTVFYVYAEDKNDNGFEDVTLVQKYVDEAGVTIKPDTNRAVDIGSNYNEVAPTITDYTYLRYKIDTSETEQTGVPSILNVQAVHTVTMIYGQDQNDNAVVDVSIGETYVDEAGLEIATPTSRAVDKGSAYSKDAPIINDYIYMGYKMDGSTTLQTGRPSLLDVQTPHQVIFVYGKDANSNGIIDSMEATITAKYVDESSVTIKPDDARIVEINSNYSKAAPTITGYVYLGFSVDENPVIETGNPSLTNVQVSHTITLVYGVDTNSNGISESQEVRITEKYVDRNGNAIGEADTVKIIDKSSPAGYSKPISTLPKVEDNVYVGYKLAGESAGTALHIGDPANIAGPIAIDTTITYVYAEDNNNNGAEDFTIIEKFVDEEGSTIRQNTGTVVDIGEAYTGISPIITDFTYLKYFVDESTTAQTGVPTISTVQAAHTITMMYGQDRNDSGIVDVTISETFVDEAGLEIATATEKFVDIGDNYNKEAPIITGYTYIGYKLDGDSAVLTVHPSMVNVQAPHQVSMVYGVDANNNGILDSKEVTITAKYVDENNQVIKPDDVKIVEINGDYTKAPPTIASYIYLGYRIDETPTLLPGNPALINMTVSHTVAMVYGKDADGNHIVDSQEVIITEKYLDRNGDPIGPVDTTKKIDKNSLAGYSRTVANLPVLDDYMYVGYHLAGDLAGAALHTDDPVAIAGPITADTTISYVYANDTNNNGAEDTQIVEKYIDQAGATIKPDSSQTTDLASDYTRPAPTINDYTYLGYKVDGSTALITGQPTITDVTGAHTVTMIYGQDKTDDGIVDVSISETYVDEAGTEIATAIIKNVNIGANYVRIVPIITNYSYLGYKVDGDPTLQTGIPMITNVQTTHAVKIVYGKDSNTNGIADSWEATITAKYVDESGVSIKEDTSKIVVINADYTKAPPTITDYIYQGYKVDADVVLLPGNPSLTGVIASHTVTLVYGKDADGNGIVDSQEIIITEKYVNRSDLAIGVVDTTKKIDKNLAAGYTRAVSSLPIVQDYVYIGYRLAGETTGTALHTDDPTTITGPIAVATNIRFVYADDQNNNGTEDVPITEKYVDETGATIKDDSSQTTDIGSDYTRPAPTINQYTYLGFKIDGSADLTTGQPTIADVVGTHVVTMVYGQDKTGDGEVDVSLSETYVDEVGAEVALPSISNVNIGDDYNKVPPIITNAIYLGYKIDEDQVLKTGNPTLVEVQIAHSVTMVYGKDSNTNGIVDSQEATITAKYVDEVGVSIKTDDSKIVSINADYTKAPPTITDYIYLGYKVDADSTLLPGNPSLTNVTASRIVTLVYGKDADGNDIVDSMEIIITEKYIDRNGNAIGQVDTTKKIDKNSPAGYSRAISGLPTVQDAVYVGYRLTGETAETALHTVDPATIAGPIAADTTISFVYADDKNNNGTEDVPITEKYVDEAGSTIRDDSSQTTDIGSDYTRPAPTVNQYTYLGFKVDGSTELFTGQPTITDVIVAHTVTMVYGQDRTGDGEVDVSISEKYVDEAGADITTATTNHVNIGDNYQGSVPIITNYIYLGYQVDGDVALQTGNPAIPAVQTEHAVTLVYGRDSNTNGIVDSQEATITAKYVDENNLPIRADDAKIVVINANYSKAAPTIATYIYQGYKIDADVTLLPGNPSLTNVTASHTITLVYGKDADGNGIVDSQEVIVTEKYVDRNGDSIGQVDTTKKIDKNSTAGYSRVVSGLPVTNDYVYVGYRLAGEAIGTALHPDDPANITGPIIADTTISFVYADDQNNNGAEDVQITEKYVDEAGVTIEVDTSQTTDIGSQYTRPAPTINHYTYLGYRVDGGTELVAGQPSVAGIIAAHTVTMVYGQDKTGDGKVDVSISENYVDEAGADISTATIRNVNIDDDYERVPSIISTYIYLGYKLDEDPALKLGSPVIVDVKTEHTVIMVYGKDSNTNGIVDSQEATITAKYVDENGLLIKADDARIVSINANYTKAPPTIATYIYQGYKIDAEAVLLPGNPSLTNVTASHTITLVYGKDANGNSIIDSQEVIVTEQYVNRSGNAIGQTDTTKTIDKNSAAGFSRAVSTLPTVSDYVYVGYQLAGELAGATLHTDDTATIIGPIVADTTIRFVYADDINDNGAEDVSITEKYVNESSSTIKDDTSQITDLGSDYTRSAPTINEFTYLGYRIDDNLELSAGQPSITNVAGKHVVTMVYGQDKNGDGSVDVSINEQFVDEAGTAITTPLINNVNIGDDYERTAPIITNYIYLGYKVDTDPLLLTGNPVLTNVQTVHAVTLVYGKDSNTNGIVDSLEATITAKYVDENGNSIKAEGTKIVEINANYTKAAPTITDYIYIGYQVDADPSLLSGNPSLTNVTLSHTVTMVYGKDSNGNSIVDSQEVTVTEKYVDRNGQAVGQADTTKIIDKNATSGYSRANAGLPVVQDFVYIGYQLAGETTETTLHTSDPATIAGPIVTDTDIRYVYGEDYNDSGIEDVAIVEKYVDEAGTLIKADSSQRVDMMSDYSRAAPTITDYTFLGYRVDDRAGTLTGTPTIEDVQKGHTITMVYGQDKTNDGQIDVSISEQFVDEASVEISAQATKNVNIGENYLAVTPVITNYIYLGYRVDADPVRQAGKPTLTNLQTEHMITMVYGKDSNANGIADSQEATITAQYVDETGQTIKANDVKIVAINANYTKAAPTITDYIYQGYQVDTNPALLAGNPLLTNVVASHTVTMVYGMDADGNGIVDSQEVIVTERYLDRNGNAIGQEATTKKIDRNSLAGYNRAMSTLPVVSTYVYAGYKLAGEGDEVPLHTNDPISIAGPIAADTEVRFVYSDDKNGNGKEDVMITESYVNETGTSIKSDTSRPVDIGSDYSRPAPSIANYVYLGYKIGADVVLQTGMANMTNIQQPTTVTMVYGQDQDEDGKKDVTIVERYEDESGLEITPVAETIVNVGETYTANVPTISAYIYLGYQLDIDNVLKAGYPSMTNVQVPHTVTMVYGKDSNSNGIVDSQEVVVTEQYLGRNGSGIGIANTTARIDQNSPTGYARSIAELPKVAGTIYAGYKLAGEAAELPLHQEDPAAIIGPITADTLITFVYGEDKTDNEIEDYPVTVIYVNEAGVPIKPTISASIDEGTDLQKPAPAIKNYVYVGYKVDGGTTIYPGDPGLSAIDNAHTITLIYGKDTNGNGIQDFTITERYLDPYVRALPAENRVYVDQGSTYTKVAPVIGNYDYLGYTIDGSIRHTGKAVTIPNVQQDSVVTFEYHAEKNVIPKPPTINPIDPEVPVVTGTGEPGTVVEVTLPDGEVITTVVGPDGTWSITTTRPLRPGETITAVTVNPSGNKSVAALENVEGKINYPIIPKTADQRNITLIFTSFLLLVILKTTANCRGKQQ